jgi:hypothetical protein
MPMVFFITHPDVSIDPSVPVPEWPLNERGRARLRAMAAYPWAREVRRIFSSGERKARDAAQILTDELGLSGYSVVHGLGENDRSATGYLPEQEFEATVDAFFANPQTASEAGSRRQMPRRGSFTPLSRWCRKPPTMVTLPLSVMGHRDAALLPFRRTADQPAARAARDEWWKLVRLRRGNAKALV